MANIQVKPNRMALLNWLINSENESVWQSLAELKDKEMDTSQVYSMAPDELRKELLEGINDAKAGRSISLEDLKNESHNW